MRLQESDLTTAEGPVGRFWREVHVPPLGIGFFYVFLQVDILLHGRVMEVALKHGEERPLIFRLGGHSLDILCHD